MKKRTERQRWLLVESVPEFRKAALVPKLVEESLRLAPDHPRESQAWAKLAARLAELAGGSKEWRGGSRAMPGPPKESANCQSALPSGPSHQD